MVHKYSSIGFGRASIFVGTFSILLGKLFVVECGYHKENTLPGGNMSKPYPTDVLSKLRTAISNWKSVDPTLKIGKLSIAELEATLKSGEALRQEISSLETQLTDLRNKRDEVYSVAWEYVTRLRSGIKAIYGDDSSEYEMVGGTRRSERKTRSRRVKVETS
jgi:hypothetical protein